jgi:hypothetical protein
MFRVNTVDVISIYFMLQIKYAVKKRDTFRFWPSVKFLSNLNRSDRYFCPRVAHNPITQADVVLDIVQRKL